MDESGFKSVNPVAHISTRYGYLAAGLAFMSFLAIQRGVLGQGWPLATILVLWCTSAAVMLHLGYGGNDQTCFGKRETGRVPLMYWIVFLPYLIPLWFRQIVLTALSREKKYEKLSDGVFIGCRPVCTHDIPPGTQVCVDLAAEFPASRAELKSGGRYVSFPILEASYRSCDDLNACIDSLPESGLYIHCAQGHGRTGFFSCALLLRRGSVETLPEALELLAKVRPGIKLRKAQIAFLEVNAPCLKGRRSATGGE